MSLPDTAEYWWDVKAGPVSYKKHTFVHLHGYPCGHYQSVTTKIMSEVDCKTCKTIIAELEPINIVIKNADLRTRCLNWFFASGKTPSKVDRMTIDTWLKTFKASPNIIKITHGFKKEYDLI